ncbi:hypothetical protein jhhlp_003824 [Lomentospora prolificans]|uniref:Myb-like domain-containing protein n=1 Tax=Lomentospora prolificans TaxID=41688 RepID=A0A2N3N9U6_9PEZI|nr:hypothetical protein jhhlp_003824 [Lomentospora prolificans]
MATIEPRLIHLLNDATTPNLPSTDLPPLQSSGGTKHRDRLPPLEPDAGIQSDKSSTNPPIPPYLLDETSGIRSGRADSRYTALDRGIGVGAASHSLRLLLGETTVADSSGHLSKILGDGVETSDESATKKRHRAITVKDDFVQLPQPVKKQKATQQQVMPPIINGLLEPPPDAALFPRIASSSFNSHDMNQLNLLREFTNVNEDRNPSGSLREPGKPSGVKTRRRSAKPRRKWTETETKDLLLGVNRYGVGKWTTILEDPDFNFNDRTAGDLKDRFRTCCPDELRTNLPTRLKGAEKSSSSPKSGFSHPAKPKAKSGLLSENILINSEEEDPQQPSADLTGDITPKQKKSRAHRKKLEDLAELGIHGPFKRSHRRERRPFTEKDDKEILEGLDIYGPAWTKIQRDPQFSLSSRQPTDLRDRVRNKYPSVYQRIEKGLFQVKDSNPGSELLEPSVNMTIENSLTKATSGPVDTQLNRPNSHDETLKWVSPNQGAELPELITVPPSVANIGEMDISRFLVDNPSDARPSGKHARAGVPSRSSSPVMGGSLAHE